MEFSALCLFEFPLSIQINFLLGWTCPLIQILYKGGMNIRHQQQCKGIVCKYEFYCEHLLSCGKLHTVVYCKMQVTPTLIDDCHGQYAIWSSFCNLVGLFNLKTILPNLSKKSTKHILIRNLT